MVCITKALCDEDKLAADIIGEDLAKKVFTFF